MGVVKKKSTTKKTNIYIIGESPLVEEYAELCAARDFAVSLQWNEPPPKQAALKNIKRSSLISPQTSLAIELTNTNLVQKKKNLEKLDRALKPDTIILSSSVTVTATEQSRWIQHPERLIGICVLPTLLSNNLIEFAAAPQTKKSSLLKAQEFFIQLGKEISVVQDRIGMVLPRIVCMIINEACFAVQEEISSPQDIDIAMKLGTNYPQGPIEWGERIGMRQVHAVLQALHNDVAEDRYRIAPLLKQMAASPEIFEASGE